MQCSTLAGSKKDFQNKRNPKDLREFLLTGQVGFDGIRGRRKGENLLVLKRKGT